AWAWLLEEVLVDVDDLHGAPHLYPHPVADHQARQLRSVDQHDPRLHLVRVALRIDAESARGEEDALAGGVAGERAHELLDRGPAHGVVARVALGLDVDAGEAQGILVDDPVDPTVPRQLRAG